MIKYTKTIQSFSLDTREKHKEDSSVEQVSLPFKDQASDLTELLHGLRKLKNLAYIFQLTAFVIRVLLLHP